MGEELSEQLHVEVKASLFAISIPTGIRFISGPYGFASEDVYDPPSQAL